MVNFSARSCIKLDLLAKEIFRNDEVRSTVNNNGVFID